MTSLCLHIILLCSVVFTYCFVLISSEDVVKLPFCGEDIKHTELILVSTLDGILSALNPSGTVLWNVETGPGSLLSSSIHHLELTNNGQWIRLIPSLSGGLYKFDGITIDAIPISADSLLKSSFRYSDDLVIAGGKEVRTYGVLINSGQSLYQCSWDGCNNTTDDTDDLDDVIIIERKTHTVRAVEPRTGIERWNFSVGQHNIKIPYINCINNNMKSLNFNLTAVLPEGLLVARQTKSYSEILWQHKFEAPIVAVWKWNGRDLSSLDLFNNGVGSVAGHTNLPSIYVGMHNNQLYVHESPIMQNLLQLKHEQNDKVPVADSKSLAQIPWKPVPATGILTNSFDDMDDSTALSVLYASEYVNGNGYYLYTADEEKPVCESNVTSAASVDVPHLQITLLYWWREAVIMVVTIAIILSIFFNLSMNTFILKGTSNQQSAILPTQYSSTSISHSDSTEQSFTSRYMMEFDAICCLGQGGFGVVFEAKKKFDECNYAIKRITLPNRPEAKDRMMREVKALAKLDHRSIVRYYNAWLECPPIEWQYEHDQKWLRDFSSYMETSVSPKQSKAKIDSSALAINLEVDNCKHSSVDDSFKGNCVMSDESSSIVFQHSATEASKSHSIIFDGSAPSVPHCGNSSHRSIDFPNQYYPTCIPPVYLYIQMQLCCKESLKDWLFKNHHRNSTQAIGIFEQIVEAVEYVHFRGLIHRDLKPSNIFFSLEGQIKVGDFGLVTNIKEYSDGSFELSPTVLQKNYTNAVGTQLYMSPEQLSSQQYDYKVDIYSLGIILFELLVSFNTEMERMFVLKDLKRSIYPNEFSSKFKKEYELLTCMLADNPSDRPTASEVRERLIELNRPYVIDEPVPYKIFGADH